jgi:hypothetical protein
LTLFLDTQLGDRGERENTEPSTISIQTRKMGFWSWARKWNCLYPIKSLI